MSVEVSDAAKYLLDAATGDGVRRWEPVAERMIREPDSALATVLTTPLMLFFARVAYSAPRSDPSELLDPSMYPDASSMEHRLTDLFVPSVFAVQRSSFRTGGETFDHKWDPADALRWLEFLAQHLAGRKTMEIAWWRLHLALPAKGAWTRKVAATIAACVVGSASGFALLGEPILGIAFGVGLGVAALVAFRGTAPRHPRTFDWRLARHTRLPITVLAFDLLMAALSTGAAHTIMNGLTTGVLIAVTSALAVGVVRRSSIPTEPAETPNPGKLLRSDRAVVGYAMVTGAVLGIVHGAIVVALYKNLESQVVVKFASPIALYTLVTANAVMVCAFGLSAIFMATSSWGKFVMARTQFARVGVLPLRLMTFLDDAHRLGVLRQVGAYYEFRHAILRDRLAARYFSRTPVRPEQPISEFIPG